MKTIFVRNGLFAMLALTLLSGCFYTADQRAWPDIDYRPRTLQLDIVNAANLSAEEVAQIREIFVKKLNDVRVTVNETSTTKLTVKVVKHNEQWGVVSAARWIVEIAGLPPTAHFTSNAFDLEGHLDMGEGQKVTFTDLPKTAESGRSFPLLLERMVRQVAGDVLTSKGLLKAQKLGLY